MTENVKTMKQRANERFQMLHTSGRRRDGARWGNVCVVEFD